MMLHVFPITLTGAAKRWVDRLPPGTVDSWHLLKKAFIQRPSLTEIINKYMEEASKRHDEQDEWLKKFYQCTQTSREAHDKIIQGLETKVKTLANEVEGRVNNGKFEECKTICTEDGSPLYTPFYYSLEEIEYFSSNSGFFDNEKQETENSRMAEALAVLEATLKIKKKPKEEK
ncbi:hypothetical protein Tco_1004337 [Tanacetum coccineum]|uniref:Retrotransposon gag domain-containing protein n=1 Tax=Tanacetum coccineum TaxID=301880 RepID=A0ABQ5FCL3_9ASTR